MWSDGSKLKPIMRHSFLVKGDGKVIADER